MRDDLDQLKRDYRRIKAPPYLAARIRAQAAEAPAYRRRWRPAIAAVAVAVAVIVLAPLLQKEPSTQTTRSSSLTMLSRIAPHKPVVPAPSLSRVRSVTSPALPSRPLLKPTPKSQTFFDTDVLKETDHAYI
ncbi:MAG: hypothetical protein ACE5OQ_16550 [Woeseia sp.]